MAVGNHRPGAHARVAAITQYQQRFYAARANGDRVGQHHTATALARLNEEHRRWRLLPGQLVIVDEAAMSGTIDLAQLSTQARRAGAKLLLVGDHRQLTPVTAGGVFGLLVRRGHSAALDGLWRFRHRWEAHATRQLRNGDPACLAGYQEHGRIAGGDHDAMLDAVHAAWTADRSAGRNSVLVAADNTTVTELNQRARTALVAAGRVSADGVELRDGTTAGVGDLIVTRENARRMRTTDGRWVRNGDTWQVIDVHPDGALTVREPGAQRDRSRAGQVLLDAHYVDEHVQLGYAITAHRAQGATVDTCHVVVSPGMTREAFYVAMTRGRHANTAYVITEHADPELEDHLHASGEPPSTHDVLRDVLATEGTERSATEQLQRHLVDTGALRAPTMNQHAPHRRPTLYPMQAASIGMQR